MSLLHERGVDLRPSDLEAENLRSCINDLVGVLSLRALWGTGEPRRIAEVLAEALSGVIEPDFVYVRLASETDGLQQQVFRHCPSSDETFTQEEVSEALDRWMGDTAYPSIGISSRTLTGRPLTLFAHHLGVKGDFGLVVIGARRSAFPTATERLVVNVAASQALIGFQENARLSEQRARATELDRLVAQRTAELAVTNKMLRRSEALLSEGQRLSLTGSLSWRPRRDEIIWSEQLCQLFDIDQGIGPEPDLILNRIHPDDLEAFKALILRGKSGALEDLQHEFRVVSRDGQVRNLQLVWRRVRDASEDPEYLGAVQDVTERKRAEASARANDARMGELRDELAHANRLATVGQLSAAISHDVRQPLTNVVLSGRTGLNWLAADPPNIAAAQRAFERVVNGGQTAAEILDRTKSFAKKSPAKRTTVTLSGIVGDTIGLVGPDARHRGITIAVDLQDSRPLIADRVQIQQVIMNLVVNAVDALSATALKPKMVDVRTWDDGPSSVAFEVRDTGPGIPAEQMSKLFDAFFTTKAEGMGMGLAICRDIVEAHGGTLRVEPNNPRGAAFMVRLPQDSELD